MARRKKTSTNATSNSNSIDTLDTEESTTSDEQISSDTELALGDETETQPAEPLTDVADLIDEMGDESDQPHTEILALGDETATQPAEPYTETLALGDETETQPAPPIVIAAPSSNTSTEASVEVADETIGNVANQEAIQPIPDNPIAATNGNVSNSTDEPTSSTNRFYPNSQLDGANPMASNNTDKMTANYENYKIMPESAWPPPMFVKNRVTPQERYYLEHRWNSQWRFFDKKANDNKQLYFRLQRIVVVGSVTVPVLVSLDPDIFAGLITMIPYITMNADAARMLIDFATVVLSLAVAIAAGLESLNKYGDNWRSYRQAAEELQAEKSFYDVNAGRYTNNPDAFSRFVERSEEIIAQQNGRFVASVEKQTPEAQKRGEEVSSGEEGEYNTIAPAPAYQETSFG